MSTRLMYPRHARHHAGANAVTVQQDFLTAACEAAAKLAAQRAAAAVGHAAQRP